MTSSVEKCTLFSVVTQLSCPWGRSSKALLSTKHKLCIHFCGRLGYKNKTKTKKQILRT